ncbi:FAD/NAD(P)-binding domain-containing protein [Setomelanomma holmii]|uniref:FAD/NAD(P)-binding domain-containing protein n=1 Tax=Setomelanomma holmii TaxID=210430 RepID=A0A9P4LM67_9PLEO|nr:FAD/NAD(P)-binding domain-containing protein [Setomelanomma holmii]
MGSLPAPELYDYEVVIVGGGFGGMYSLNNLRGLGFSTHLFEAGSSLRGIWHWNCYPGARVDTETPVYQLYAPELYETWKWKERYSGRDEMVDYFNHVADLLDLKKDITFNARVTQSYWNQSKCRWDLTASTSIGSETTEHTVTCKSIIFWTDRFQGVMRHTALWSDYIDLRDKRIAVIGTGASGVQVVQETAPIAKKLTLFQRTPNMALQMGQSVRDDEWNKISKQRYLEEVKKMETTYAGFLYDFDPRKTFDVTECERNALFEELYHKGGVYFWLGTFSDVLKNKDANKLAYEYWRKKTIARINNPTVAEKLAPKVAPHAFGTKRISLEQDYFEQFNRENVHIVDVNDDPIETFTSNGIKTKTAEHELDVICLATGFDSVIGGLTQIDIRGIDGVTIKDKWAKGVWTHLGMTSAGFPNMFFVYGPQAPTAFATGPSCAQTQGQWIGKVLSYLRQNGYNSIVPKPDAEFEWKEHVNTTAEDGLFKETKSWYFGDNIPGKARESLNYMAGLPLYRQKCAEATQNGYKNHFILA